MQILIMIIEVRCNEIRAKERKTYGFVKGGDIDISICMYDVLKSKLIS